MAQESPVGIEWTQFHQSILCPTGHITSISYRIFWKIGCQGDRMPMYRASAPFFQGDKGDRRVTGVGAHSAQRGDNQCFEYRLTRWG